MNLLCMLHVRALAPAAGTSSRLHVHARIHLRLYAQCQVHCRFDMTRVCVCVSFSVSEFAL